VLRPVGRGKFGRLGALLPDNADEFAPETRAVLKDIFDLAARIADRGQPASRGSIDGEPTSLNRCLIMRIRRLWDFSSVRCDFPKLSISSARFPQINRKIRVLRATKRSCLLLSPRHEVAVIELAQLFHI
jgi:hypothetical protein